MVELPFSETITISRHLRVRSLRSHLTQSSLDELRDTTTPPPSAADALGRSAQRFEMAVRARQGDTVPRAGRTSTPSPRRWSWRPRPG